MENKLTPEQTVKALKKEMADLNRCRKSYTYQSEWHRMMYERAIRIESLEKSIKFYTQK